MSTPPNEGAMWALLTLVICRDEDFDVSENTILDSQLFPEHFEQVAKSIFTELDQCALPVFIYAVCTVLTGLAMSVPSIIKAHFS